VVVGVDEVEVIQVFEVIADPPVAKSFFLVGLDELLISLVDIAGLDLVLFGVKLFDSLVE